MENKEKAPKRIREVPQKRDLFSKHYLNEDGSYTAEIGIGIVHYKDENDQFQDVSVDLFDEDDFDAVDFPVTKEKKASFKARKEITVGLKKKSTDGKLSRDTSDFHGLKVPFDATIPKLFKKGYSIGKGSDRLTFKPEGASNSKAERIGSNALKYPGVWNHADVILELKDNGLKETIILMDPAAPNIFTFEVTGPLKDDLSAGALRLDAAWLIDANGERRDVQQNIRKQGAKTFLDVVADVYGLTYPIEIDPTVTIQPDGTAGTDAVILSYAPTGNNNTGTLYTGADASTIYRSLLKFDLSFIPIGSFISSGVLSLYSVSTGGTSGTKVNIHGITSAWQEAAVTWATQPTFDSTPTASVGVGGNDVFYNFDIKTLLQSWVDGTKNNEGMMLKSDLESNGNSWRSYPSSDNTDSTKRPKLSITYNVPPTAPTVTAPNGGETWNSSHTVAWLGSLDDKEYNIAPNSFNLVALNNSYEYGNTYTVVNTGKIKEVSFYNQDQSLGSATLYIKNAVGDLPGTTIHAQKSISGFGVGKHTFVLDTPLSVTAGQKLALSLTHSNSVSVSYLMDSSQPYAGGIAYWGPIGGTLNSQSYDFKFDVVEQAGVTLQYQIQLTTDGTNWGDIVALTTAGATQYTHDFINAPESTTAKIRIRAYDGSAYGPWDESNANFTIQHNQAPNKPTNTSPAGTSATPAVVSTLTPAVSWTFSDPDGNPQASRQILVYDAAGVLKHDSGVSAGAATSYTLPGAILAWKTKYYWRVRTFDAAGAASAYSDDQWFLTNQGPTGTITAPSATSGVGTIFNDTLQPTFTWTYSDPNGDVQKSVQILIKDGAATVFDSGEIVTTGLTYQIPLTANLIYDKTYTTQIRAKDVNDTWGSYSALKYFHLNRSPNAPTGLSPSGTTGTPEVIQDNLQPALSWTFSDSDATDTQSAYKAIIYDSTSGSIVRDSGWVVSTAKSYTVPAGVLISGKKYHYVIAVKDVHGKDGPFTANQYFYTNAAPNTPTSPSPAGGSAASPATILDDLTPTLSWTFGDPNSGDTQKAFQVKLYNEAGTLLMDSGEVVSGAGSYEIPQAFKLAYSQKYQWEVRTKDQFDAWSSYTPRGWITAKVGAPSGVTATVDNFGAKIIIDWTDSLSEALQGYNIYRSTSLGGTYTKLNTSGLITQSLYNDSQVSTGTTYYYKIEAYVTDLEISPLSAAVSAVATFSSWYIGAFKFIGPSSMSGGRERAQSKRATLGKKKKVVQDRGFFGEVINLQLVLSKDEYSTGKQKFDSLMAELEKTQALSVRDPFGQVWKVSPGSVTYNLLTGTGDLTYEITIPLEEVD